MKIFQIIIVTFLMMLVSILSLQVILRKFNQNKAFTSPHHEDPKLRTRIYLTDKDLLTICHRIGSIIPQMTNYGLRWKLIDSDCYPDPDEVITLRAEVPVFMYRDDLEIKLWQGKIPGTFVVNVNSASRVGKSDLGENRRHVLDILKVLDEEFNR